MNESASKASLASSGKPSTASSSVSPNGRKTRTIIVARNIPDDPAAVHPAPGRNGGHASTASVVAHQHHTRDARSGKLASYAALGGDEDVERFDQFLAEQRGQPRASELRAATTSPQHMLASMKRKTMSRLQLDVTDGKADAVVEDPAVRKQVQQELENDAKKRREEALAHRKWLNSLPIHERVAQQRQQNALRKWRQMNHDWETFKARAARRLGKPPKELVMSRAASYREQREMYDALQKARPLSDKVGGDIWLVSLRNEGTRFVPVGNIFSGLFCPIRESTRLGPRVRRPLDYHNNPDDLEYETSRPVSKLERRSLQLLARKKWRLRKQLEALQPHEIQRSAGSQLAVGTSDLFAWAGGAVSEAHDNDDDAESLRSYSVHTDDKSSSRRRLLSQASMISLNSVGNTVQDEQYVGPSVLIAHVADDEDEPVSNQDKDTLLSESSALTDDSPLRLSFYVPVGEQQQRSLAITNDGSTIVHYHWWRARFEDDSVGLTDHLRGQRSRKEEQELESCKFTSVSRIGGTLLPGETQVFAFTFQASQAGVFLEKWLLDAAPRPRIRYGAPPMDREAKKAELPVEVRLSCVAEDNFSARSRRQRQRTRVEQREAHFFVALLVDEIIDNVKPKEVASFPELAPTSDATKFYEQNSSGDFGDVYFSTDLVRDLLALFDQAKHFLEILSPQPTQTAPQVDESATQIAGDEGGQSQAVQDTIQTVENAEADADAHEVTSTAVVPSENTTQYWDWRMETLREVVKLADEAQLTRMKQLLILLKKEEEVDEEDDDENEDDDAEEASDEDDEDADEDEDGNEVEKVDVAKVPKLTHRQIRENERLARCKALRDEIGELQPDLQERFEMLRFAGCTAPYNTRRLHERLHERIGSLCSETPVVCEIAKVLNPAGTSPAFQLAKTDSVKSLLMRAVDEAIGGDMDHQTLFEQERRRLQGVWLHDQRSYKTLPQHVANRSMAAPPPTDASEENNPPVEPLDNSGAVLMHVDLDIAPWFSLVKADKAGAGSPDEVSPEGELVWRLSQDLLQHDTYVPPKVTTVADSLNKLINSLPRTDHPIHTVVLVSELSRPPVTKKMLKLLRNAVRADMKAKSPVSKEEGGESETNTAQESNELEETLAIKALLQRLSRQLSLRGIAQVLQRAVQKDVVFCSSFEEVHGQVDFSKKELLLSTSVSLGAANEAPSQEAASELTDEHYSPRIVLVDHLDAAGRELVLQNARRREALSSKPATPAPAEVQKAGAKKGSVAVASSRKPGTPGAATPAAPESPSPSQIVDVSEEEIGRQLMPALREQFVRLFGECVLDVIPSQLWESAFSCCKGSVGPVFAGPTLCHELDTWAEILQPQGFPESRPRCITAIVGGKSLEAKLRFIDGLLEVVQEIYFVGEVAMSLYKVLHTKQRSKSPVRFSASVEHEKGGNIEEVDTGNDDENDISSFTDGDLNDDIPEEEGEQESKTVPDSSASKRPKGLWEILGPAVEKLQQKANRKCVRLFLPRDWIVGEVSLDEQDLSMPTVEDDDDDEDDLDEVEEEEETDRKRRKRSSEMKMARQKPLVEPEEEDILDRKKQFAYEGERAHVVLNGASSKSAVGWLSFQDVTRTCLSSARVTEGKSSVLTSLETAESDTEEGDEEGASGEGSSMAHKRSAARFEYEWTFRAFDVGPLAMEALGRLLGHTSETGPQDRVLVVNGVCGAVEFQEFSTATKTLVEILRDNDQSQVFIAGNATSTWLHEFEIQQSLASARETGKDGISAGMSTTSETARAKPRKVIDDRVKRNSSALKHIIAAKPCLALVDLIPSA